VVGARTGPVQLMLYAVFRIGGATNNIRMDSVQRAGRAPRGGLDGAHLAGRFAPRPAGAGHHARVLHSVSATATGSPWQLAQGRAFSGTLDGLYEAVLGAEVADTLGYRLGQRITLAHGGGGMPGSEHADKPFTVVGVLARTGTPVDRTVHVSLQALEAIHLDWVGGAPMPGLRIAPEQARKFDLQPKQVTAALVGLKSRAAVFNVQRWVAAYEAEPLLAVLPGVALDELWDVVGVGERALQAMSGWWRWSAWHRWWRWCWPV
jgi:putative ABC transport system permease protein